MGKIIKWTAPKSCCLDPVPTVIVKECLNILLAIITRIISQSFRSTHVPKSFKLAGVTSIIKKINLIAELLKNFKQISELPFLSKVIEKVAAKHLITHIEVNNL